MAQYKVPQDVEADDKLIGPFSFRQFVYLLIAAGLIALAVALFQLFPLLAIIPLPLVLLFVALALPLKKDQPMETYLAAIVSYYLKPRNRTWTPGQSESVIKITAPKIVEEGRTRDITGEEATHRLSFLVDIVDTGGYAIKGASTNPMREDLIAEANATEDMFETSHFDKLESTIVRDENERHREVVSEMRQAIDRNENMNIMSDTAPTVSRRFSNVFEEERLGQPRFDSPVVVAPGVGVVENSVEKVEQKPIEKSETTMAKPSIIELANNSDYSVATISKEAKRIKERDEGEVFISLH